VARREGQDWGLMTVSTLDGVSTHFLREGEGVAIGALGEEEWDELPIGEIGKVLLVVLIDMPQVFRLVQSYAWK